MKRTLLAVVVALAAAALPAQTETAAAGERPDSLIEVIDVIESIRSRAFNEGAETLSDADFAELRSAVEMAMLLGAEDLAAQGRMLEVYLRDPAAFQTSSPAVELDAFSASPGREFNQRFFRIAMNTAGTVGATALIASGVFHYLAERRYEQGLLAADPGTGDPDLAARYYREWEIYDRVSFWTGMSGAAVLVGGVPLALGSGALWAADLRVAGTPATYTLEERNREIARLQVEREEIVARLHGLEAKESRRQVITRWSLGAGGAGLAVSVTSLLLANLFYNQYLDAAYTTDDQAPGAEGLGTLVRVLDVVGISGGVVAAGGLGTAGTVAIFTTSRQELTRKLQRVNEQIIDLRLAEPMAPLAPMAPEAAE